MLVSPGDDLDLYLDLTRNGEPVNSETVPVVAGLWFNGVNLLGAPVAMATLDTGLYFASLALDQSTAIGVYQADLRFTRLGKVRRETQAVNVVPDQHRVSMLMDANLPANTEMTFIKAITDNLITNAAAGRYAEVQFRHKTSAQVTFASPVAQGVRTLFYDRLGDSEPSRAGV